MNKDNNNQYFYWVDIKQLNSYKVYPESTIKLIKSEKLFKHNYKIFTKKELDTIMEECIEMVINKI